MGDAGISLPTTLEALQAQAAEVAAVLDELLEHCQLRYEDINADARGVVVIGWSPWRWAPLPNAAQRHVGEADRAWLSFNELAEQAVSATAPKRTRALEQADHLLRRIIDQDDGWHGAPGDSIAQIRERVAKSLDGVLELVSALPSAHGESRNLLVPDTNALLFKPELATWNPPHGEWTVVLVPQVLRELDALKMRPGVGDKAAGVIRRIKEYARRGDTFSGVPLAPRLRLREVAVDADMTKTLSWLRAQHGDDELLASVLELRWTDLSSVVAIATRDRNLQNKARMARVPYLDVENDI